MKIILETDRLTLREFMANDGEQLYALNVDPEVIRYTGDRSFSSIAQAEAFIRDYPDYRLNGFGRWAIVLKRTNRFIGWCGLKLNEESYVDLGFRLFQYEWRKGYGTEAAKATLDYGFNTLLMKEVIGRTSQKNLGSIKILEKLGFSFWKYAPCNGIENSAYYRINNQSHKSQNT